MKMTIRILRRFLPKSLLARLLVAGRRAIEEGQLTPAESLSLGYKGTNFKLYVVEGDLFAYRDYTRWADGKTVYERVMLECLTRLLRRTERPGFIDIGSFMGHYACYAAALLGDREETYAVESNPRYYAATLRSIGLNGFTRIKAFNEVLSDSVENVVVDDRAVLLFEPQETKAQSVTLDELCRREDIRPKIAKIDVHGSEGKVLMGMQEVMRQQLEYILLELHPLESLRAYSGDIGPSEILTVLERLGFHVFHIAGHRCEGGKDLTWALEEGVDYCRVEAKNRDFLLFDRPHDVFLLCSKRTDLETFLAPMEQMSPHSVEPT